MAAPPPSVPPVKRHHWIVRLTHWLTFLLLIGMITSGLQIYGAYARFGERGGPYYAPNPFQDHGFPAWSRLGGWLAGALNWHFTLMWPLIAGGLLYLSYLVASGEWRSLLFRPRDIRGAIEMQKYYLRLRKDHPPQGKHNPLQKLAYSFIIFMGVLSVITGFAIYKPTQRSSQRAGGTAVTPFGRCCSMSAASTTGWERRSFSPRAGSHPNTTSSNGPPPCRATSSPR